MRGSELLLRKSPISPVGISCSDGMIKAGYARSRGWATHAATRFHQSDWGHGGVAARGAGAPGRAGVADRGADPLLTDRSRGSNPHRSVSRHTTKTGLDRPPQRSDRVSLG